jgi:hypothetical protein
MTGVSWMAVIDALVANEEMVGIEGHRTPA